MTVSVYVTNLVFVRVYSRNCKQTFHLPALFFCALDSFTAELTHQQTKACKKCVFDINYNLSSI